MSLPEVQAVDRKCPLCDARTSDRVWAQKGALRIVRCTGCGMLYASPVPSELASGEFYDRMGVPFYLARDKLQSDYSPVRFEREVRLFRSFCRKGEVLDVGCSSGGFLYSLKTRFPGEYELFGTDVTQAALDYAEEKGIRVIRGSFPEYDFGSQRFDAVTFWAVMEHLVDPKRFLRKTADVLKEGGICFILVPNMESLAVRILGAKYRYIMPDHVNYFTKETLGRFAAAESRFEPAGVWSTHFNPLVILQDLRRPRDRVPDEQRAALLKRTTAWKQNRALLPVKWLYGGVEGLLGAASLADNLVIALRRK